MTIGCLIAVHRALGPGFREKIYHRALISELEAAGLSFELEKRIPIFYRGLQVGLHKLDLVIENTIVIELKAIKEITKAHYAQLRSYLRASECQIGLLVNFSLERTDIRRIDCPGLSLSPYTPPLSPAGESRAKRINKAE